MNQETNPPANPSIIKSLEKQLLAISTLVIATKTKRQDRWGNPLGLRIHALRLGTKCLLLSQFPDVGDPDSPEEITIERLVSSKVILWPAQEIYRGYYESLPAKLLAYPHQVEDKTVQTGEVLDGLYILTPGVPSAKPSEVLTKVTQAETAESPDLWSWFDDTLHLTAWVFKRTGLCNGRAFFDELLTQIFAALKFNVQNVKLIHKDGAIPFQDRVRLSQRAERVERLKDKIWDARERLKEVRLQSWAEHRIIRLSQEELRSLETAKT